MLPAESIPNQPVHSALLVNHALAAIVTQFDDPRYLGLALALQHQFRENSPYPHAVLDDFLSPDVARVLAESYPEPSDSSGPSNTDADEKVSRRIVEGTALSLPMRLFADAVIGRQFLLFVEALSGVDSLIADPYFIGGGARISTRDQRPKAHADLNWHQKLQMHRRVHFLLYLTPNWQSDWGGELALCPKDINCVASKKIVPRFNRAVVVEVANDSNHEQPEPLRSPNGICQRVFSSFYYSTRRIWASSDSARPSPHGKYSGH